MCSTLLKYHQEMCSQKPLSAGMCSQKRVPLLYVFVSVTPACETSSTGLLATSSGQTFYMRTTKDRTLSTSQCHPPLMTLHSV